MHQLEIKNQADADRWRVFHTCRAASWKRASNCSQGVEPGTPVTVIRASLLATGALTVNRPAFKSRSHLVCQRLTPFSNMASGIAVSDKCVSAYNSLSKRAASIVVLKINSAMTDVEVENSLPPSSGDFEAQWKAFTKTLPDDECRYVIVDFQWNDSPTVVKSKVISVVSSRLPYLSLRC